VQLFPFSMWPFPHQDPPKGIIPMRFSSFLFRILTAYLLSTALAAGDGDTTGQRPDAHFRQHARGGKSRIRGVPLRVLEDARNRTLNGAVTSCVELIWSRFQAGAFPQPLSSATTITVLQEEHTPSATTRATTLQNARQGIGGRNASTSPPPPPLVFLNIPKGAGAEIEAVTLDARTQELSCIVAPRRLNTSSCELVSRAKLFVSRLALLPLLCCPSSR